MLFPHCMIQKHVHLNAFHRETITALQIILVLMSFSCTSQYTITQYISVWCDMLSPELFELNCAKLTSVTIFLSSWDKDTHMWKLWSVHKCFFFFPYRWNTAGLALCGMQQCWSTSLIMMRIAPSTLSAVAHQTVDMVSPCSTAAPTGTFSPRGKSRNSKQQ